MHRFTRDSLQLEWRWKGYCEGNGIKHNPQIPESDCGATLKLFQDLITRFGIDYLLSIAKEC